MTRVITIATAAVNLITLSHPSIDLVKIDIYRLQRTQTHPYPSVTCYVLCVQDGHRVHRKSRDPVTLPWPRCVIVALRDDSEHCPRAACRYIKSGSYGQTLQLKIASRVHGKFSDKINLIDMILTNFVTISYNL